MYVRPSYALKLKELPLLYINLKRLRVSKMVVTYLPMAAGELPIKSSASRNARLRTRTRTRT